MTQDKSGAPRASLSIVDGALMMVGIIIGIGIFKTPQIVALNVSSEAWFIGATHGDAEVDATLVAARKAFAA